MAKRFQAAIDLQKFELQNARVQNLGGPPTTPVEGQIYYDTLLKQFGYWNLTAWVYGTTAPDATTSVKGIVQLTNDLSGTATAPIVNHFTLTSDSSAGSHRITSLTGLDLVTSTSQSGGVTFGGNEFQLYRSAANCLNFGGGGAAPFLIVDQLTGTGAATLQLVARSAGTAKGVNVTASTLGELNLVASSTQPINLMTGNAFVGGVLGNSTLTVDPGSSAASAAATLTLTGRDPSSVAKSASLTVFGAGGSAGSLNINVPAGQAVSLTTSARITGVADPTAAQDAATKNYVDNLVVTGVAWKTPVLVATTGAEAYTIAGGACTQITGTTIDGISPAVNDRILVKNAPSATGAGVATATTSSSTTPNGIYVVTNATTNLTIARSADADTGPEITGAATVVMRGSNAEATWVCSTDPPITINTSFIAWTYTGGNAIQGDNTYITRSGNTIGPVAVPVDPTAGANGSVVATAAALSRVVRFAIKGDGSTTAFTCTHNLGNRAVWAIGFQDSAGAPAAPVEIDYASSSTSAIAVTFPAAPTAGQIFYVEVVG